MSPRSVIVNAITFARLPLVFSWAVFAILQELSADSGGGSLALAVCAGLSMLLAGLTDAWDGALARRWGVVSALGKMADPLMDKVFYIVAFPTLLWQILRQGGEGSGAHAIAMLAFTVLYMLRDTWVTFMRAVGTMFGADVAAMWLGKVRTALSFPGAGWVYAYLCFNRMVPGLDASWRRAWLGSCFAVEGLLFLLTLWSLWTYTAAYMPYLKRALERK